MRLIWQLHRRTLVAAGVAVVLVVAAISLAIGSGRHHATGTSPPSPDRRSAETSPAVSAGPGATSHGPLRVNPPATPTQTQMDAQLAASESPASIAQAERQSVPVPAVSEQFPALPVGDEADATAYALGFCRELLDIRYRRQSRAELLEWAQYEEAPDSLPGVPAPIADKSLVGSLAYAGTSGAEPTPIPATGDWSHAATVGTVQQVSALAAAVAPDWTELVATGWEPVDPLMTIITVTGIITTSTPGQPASILPFSLALTVGGARHHPGYGAVAVSAWTET